MPEKAKKESFLRRIISLLKTTIDILKKIAVLLKPKEKGFGNFARDLRRRESGNDYKIVNPYGYLGAYQFGMARLCDLGYTERIPNTSGFSNKVFRWKSGFSKSYFLSNSDFQDKVFKEHVLRLIKQINYGLPSQYIGGQVRGIKITLSGLVAGAHLGGLGGIRRFLKYGQTSEDAFGTSVSDYIKKFAGYNLQKINA